VLIVRQLDIKSSENALHIVIIAQERIFAKYPFYCVVKYLNTIGYFHAVETLQFSAIVTKIHTRTSYNIAVCLETTLMKNAMFILGLDINFSE